MCGGGGRGKARFVKGRFGGRGEKEDPVWREEREWVGGGGRPVGERNYITSMTWTLVISMRTICIIHQFPIFLN